MALVAQCDGGCGATGDAKDFRSFGLVRQVQYCEDCAKLLSLLYEARDMEHTRHALALEGELLRHVHEFLTILPGAKLPDARD